MFGRSQVAARTGVPVSSGEFAGSELGGVQMATALVDLYGGQPLPFDRIILSEGYRPAESEEFMCDLHRA
jgi:hypothetical protein